MEEVGDAPRRGEGLGQIYHLDGVISYRSPLLRLLPLGDGIRDPITIA